MRLACEEAGVRLKVYLSDNALRMATMLMGVLGVAIISTGGCDFQSGRNEYCERSVTGGERNLALS